MDALATIADMGKRQNKRPDEPKKPGRPSAGGRKPAYILHVRLDPTLGDALESCIEGTKPKPTLTSLVTLALQQYLQGVGYLPESPGEDE